MKSPSHAEAAAGLFLTTTNAKIRDLEESIRSDHSDNLACARYLVGTWLRPMYLTHAAIGAMVEASALVQDEQDRIRAWGIELDKTARTSTARREFLCATIQTSDRLEFIRAKFIQAATAGKEAIDHAQHGSEAIR